MKNVLITLNILLLLVGQPLLAKSAIKKKAQAPVAKKAPLPLDELRLVEGDEKGNEVKSLKTEILVNRAEQAAIAQAYKILKKYKGTELEPEIQFRLAELYMRKSKTDRFFEVHRESETIVKLAPQAVKAASSRESVEKAVEIYALIGKKWPEFAQMDLVIFNHAFALQALGKEKDSESLYQQLVNQHVTSPLVPDAHLAIGEIAFNRAQFAVALDHFNAIKRFPESRVYPYGLYKAAWTHYNMRNAEMGLKKLEEVVAYGKFVEQNKMESRLDLRKEALADMTIFYEDVYPAKDAYKYFFEQAGESEVGPTLLKMASLYERHARFNDQKTVLLKFADKLPQSPLIPKIQTDLISAFDALKQKDQAVSQLEELHKICQPSSRWTRSQVSKSKEGDAVAAECRAGLNETALRLARKWLKAWKRLPADTSYADASEKAFEVYLRTSAKTEEYVQSRYAYAELLFNRGKFRKASEEYARVSQSEAPPASLGHDASYAAVLSLQKAVGEKWSSDDERAFNRLAKDYIQKHPKGPHRLDLEYKMALLAYEKERFDEAAPAFLQIGRDFPKQEKGMKAQDLYLDILNIKKDYRGIRAYTKEILAGAPEAQREQKMRKLHEQAYFLEIQTAEEKGDLKGALKEYLTFAKQSSGSELVEKALWNAMHIHYKLKDLWNGAKTAEEFGSRFPQSPQAINALLRSAQSFEQIGQLSEAARVLLKLSEADIKAALRWRELAADFLALDSGVSEARKIYQELRQQGDVALRLRVLGKMEVLEKNYGTAESHAAILKTMVELNVQPQAADAKIRMIEKDFEDDRFEQAFSESKRWLGASGLSANQKARLRLIQAKILEKEFLKQSVKSKAERLELVLAIKTEKLQKAQEALQSTIKYGDPQSSMEAFERLYGCYKHYVNALKDMPTPEGLSATQAQALRAELDQLLIPLEEKSVDTLSQAVLFARKQQFLDGTLNRLEAELNRLNKKVEAVGEIELEKPAVVLPVLAGVGP